MAVGRHSTEEVGHEASKAVASGVEAEDGKPSGLPRDVETMVVNLQRRFPQHTREDIVAELARADYHAGKAERRLIGASDAIADPEHEKILDTLVERFPQYDPADIAAELLSTNYHGGQAISRLHEKAIRAGGKPPDWPAHADAILDTLVERCPQYERRDIIAELVSCNYHGGQALNRLRDKAPRPSVGDLAMVVRAREGHTKAQRYVGQCATIVLDDQLSGQPYELQGMDAWFFDDEVAKVKA